MITVPARKAVRKSRSTYAHEVLQTVNVQIQISTLITIMIILEFPSGLRFGLGPHNLAGQPCSVGLFTLRIKGRRWADSNLFSCSLLVACGKSSHHTHAHTRGHASTQVCHLVHDSLGHWTQPTKLELFEAWPALVCSLFPAPRSSHGRLAESMNVAPCSLAT